MRSPLRDAGWALLGVALGVIGTQRPDLAPALVVAAAVCFLIYFTLGLAPLRRRIPPLRTQEDRNDILRVRLADHVREGNRLMTEAAKLTDQRDLLDDLEQRCGGWAGGVCADLQQNRPGWEALFLDDAYGPVQFMSQYGQRDRIRNWLERRLAKLGELVRQL